MRFSWRSPHWILLIFSLVMATLVFSCPFTVDFDIYLHLLEGKLMLQSWRLDRFDRFTFTAPGAPNEIHSWLSQILIWLSYTVGGTRGVRLLMAVASVLSIYFAHAFAWRRTRSLAACFAADTAFFFIHRYFYTARPFVLGEACFCYFVFAFHSEQPLRRRDLARLALVGIVWTNLHANGLLLVPLTAIFAAPWYWRALRTRRYAPYRYSLLSPLVAVAATCINPQGPKLYAYSYNLTRTGQAQKYFHWQSLLTLPDFSAVDVTLLVLGLVALFWLLLRHDRELSGEEKAQQISLTAFLLSLCLISQQHLLFTIYPATFFTAGLTRKLEAALFPARASALALLCVAAVCARLLIAAPFYRSPLTFTGPEVNHVIAFLREVRPQGNILASPLFGHYLSFAFYPNLKVGFDHRSLVNKQNQLDLWELMNRPSTEIGPKLLEHYPTANWELYSVFEPGWLPEGNPRWLRAYENNQFSLWLRKDSREQVERVAGYYQKRRIPFDRERGFSQTAAFAANPRWLFAQLEKPLYDYWPDPEVQLKYKESVREYCERNHFSCPPALQ